MKKLYILLFVIAGLNMLSQDEATYAKLITFIHQQHPDMVTDNKLIVVCVWSSSDIGSRETNKELVQLHNTYQGAVLKDSRKGMILVSLSSDQDEVTYQIAVKKDNIQNCIVYSDFKGVASGLLGDLKLSTPAGLAYSGKGELLFKQIDKANAKASVVGLLVR